MNTTTCSERAILVPIATFSSLVILLQEAARSMTVAPERASEYIAKAADLLRTNGAAGQISEDRPLFETEFRALAPWKIRRIVAYVEENLAAKLEVAQMAHLVGLSICHFSRSFKNSMGVTPRRYILRKRVHRATQLMADPGESLTDIALACGFADQSHFSRVFKQILRLSPGSWRRNYIGPPGGSEAGTSAKTAGTRKSAWQPTAVDDGNSALSDAALESAQTGSRQPVVLNLEN